MDKNKVVSGLIWRCLERFGAQAVSFVVSIVLARLLEPSVYGSVALVTVITSLLQVFVDSGMGNALIQKKNADELDFSTMFVFNLIIGVVLYAIAFALAPAIAAFYNMPELVAVIRVLSVVLVISGVKNVQQAYISRTMQFKRFFFATLGGTIGAAIVGIGMAWAGFGVWALVGQYIFNSTVDTIILWITGDWRPKFRFSFQRFKTLYAFGWKLLVASLLDTIYTDCTQLAMGKVYSVENLAYFNRGKVYPGLIVISVNSSIESVVFPAMAKVQDDISRLRAMTRRYIQVGIYVMAPLLIGLAFVGQSVIRIMLTDKWLDCVIYLQIFCIIYMFMPIQTANLNAIKALGKSGLVLKMEYIKKIIGMVTLLGTVWISVKAIAYGMLVVCLMNQIINAYVQKKLIDYGYLEQLADVLLPIVLATIMGVCIYPISLFHLSDLICLIAQILIGACIYLVSSRLLKLPGFDLMWNMVTSLIKKSD